MTLLLVFAGIMVAGKDGLIIGLCVAVFMNFFSYFFSDKIVLAIYHAKKIPDTDTRILPIIKDLTNKSGLPMPKVYIIEDPSPNAFATGRDPRHAAVAVTSGILELLDRDELEGVLAHELSHVKNRDILISSIAAVLAGTIAVICRFILIFGGGDSNNKRGVNILIALLFSILASIAMMLIQMWLSRTREYLADASGAEMCGKPWALANALDKLQRGVSEKPMQKAEPITENMFIVNPFKAKTIANVFSTHPPTEERIKRLKEMNNQVIKY